RARRWWLAGFIRRPSGRLELVADAAGDFVRVHEIAARLQTSPLNSIHFVAGFWLLARERTRTPANGLFRALAFHPFVADFARGLLNRVRNAMSDEINLGGTHAESRRYLRRGPLLQHTVVEDLKVLWIRCLLHPRHRFGEH